MAKGAFVLEEMLSSLSFVDFFNMCVFVVFTCCYAYQIIYVFVSLAKKPPELTAKKNHRYAVLISARNENAVIGDLIHSIRVQNYPQELIDIFVIADNCTDNTAAVAQEAGAIVFLDLIRKKLARAMRSIMDSLVFASIMQITNMKRILSLMRITFWTLTTSVR